MVSWTTTSQGNWNIFLNEKQMLPESHTINPMNRNQKYGTFFFQTIQLVEGLGVWLRNRKHQLGEIGKPTGVV